VFLSSELQAAQVARSRALSSEKEEEEKEEEGGGVGGGRSSTSLQDLQLICQTLDLPEPRGRDVEEVFSQVEEQVWLNVSQMDYVLLNTLTLRVSS